MKTGAQIYRYLRFKHRFVAGTRLCKALGISLVQLKTMDRVPGVGSMGPVYSEKLSPIRYAKYNAFCADFIAFFENDGVYHCRKDRPVIRGRVPTAKRYRRYED